MFNQIIAATSLADYTPQIAGIAAVAALLGWILKGVLNKPQPVKPVANKEIPTKDRSKSLEGALEKSKAANKATKTALEALQASSVPAAKFEEAKSSLETAQKALEAESKRTALLEADIKKAQETIKTLNGRSNEVDRVQKDRSFALENELSKVRQQLALLEARPDNTSVLHAEIERLRESVATTTRYTGELRKRETAALDALSKVQGHISSTQTVPIPAPTLVSTPVGDSDRVAAAKAEVLRLLEQNKQANAALEKFIETPPEVAHEQTEEMEIARSL